MVLIGSSQVVNSSSHVKTTVLSKEQMKIILNFYYYVTSGNEIIITVFPDNKEILSKMIEELKEYVNSDQAMIIQKIVNDINSDQEPETIGFESVMESKQVLESGTDPTMVVMRYNLKQETGSICLLVSPTFFISVLSFTKPKVEFQ